MDDDHNPNEEGLGGVEPVVIPIGTLEGFNKEAANRGLAESFKATAKIARACKACQYSFTEGQDLVCRYDPPQVTFLVVPVPITVGTPNGPQVRQGMKAVPHTSFPIIRPDLWCGRFEQKS